MSVRNQWLLSLGNLNAMQGKVKQSKAKGDFDGIIWMDAGYGVSIDYRSRAKFNYIRRYDIDHGVKSFTFDT